VSGSPVRLEDIVRFLDAELRTAQVPDFDAALNGLQLANGGQVTRIAAAVDFSAQTVAGALREQADLLLVHHGMFWGGAQPLVGAAYERLRSAIAAGLAVYSSHLPLDVHPTLGNNALLAAELSLRPERTFGRYREIEVGVSGTCDLPTRELIERLRAVSSRYGGVLVTTPLAPGQRTLHWAIITGSGASSDTLAEAMERGVDTLIVGEGPHHTAVRAMELGITVAYAGHYATETPGVRALAATVSDRFGLPWSFVDVPTGL
jgi:dinuclear metal center YbgI/SA1388 family protein